MSTPISNYTLDDLKEKRRRSASLDSGRTLGPDPLLTGSPAKKMAPSLSDPEDFEVFSPTDKDHTSVVLDYRDSPNVLDPKESARESLDQDNQVSPSNVAPTQSAPTAEGAPSFQTPPQDPHNPASYPDNTNALLHQMLSRFEKVEDKLKKLDTMEVQLAKLDVIEGNSAKLSKDILGMKNSLTSLHSDVDSVRKEADSTKNKLEKEISDLKTALVNQEAKMQSMVEGMAGEIEDRVVAKTKLHFNGFTHHLEHAFIKEQAANRKLNLIFSGIQEDANSSDLAKIREICKTQLGLKQLAIGSAHRIGTKRPSASKPRLVLVHFSAFEDRKRVWQLKKKFQHSPGVSVWVQEDMPRALREDLRILLKDAKYANSLHKEEYKSISVKDFRLHFNGESFGAHELERLPYELRPSSLCTKWADDLVVFFGRFSPLSNHHFSPFVHNDTHFSCVEQYLAVEKARLVGKTDILERALSCPNPADCKGILNALRDDCSTDWEDKCSSTLLMALRCKFNQNKLLGDFLRKTYPRYLGEASTNAQWGIGLDLSDPQALVHESWLPTGNLLGKSLCVVRGELIQELGLL